MQHHAAMLHNLLVHVLIVSAGNLHQSQYTEKLKSIVEFLGPKLSMEELTTIWEMQVDKNPVQVTYYSVRDDLTIAS